MAENPIRAVPQEEPEPNAIVREPDGVGTVRTTRRLERRIKALRRRHRQIVPNNPVKLLTTDELRRALALTERAGVLPNGDVRCPGVLHAASQEEWAALERWAALCGEPLDHIEAAEELLDRMGEVSGWRSREAGEAALLLSRLRQPHATHRLVGEVAYATITFYAELEAHHPGGCGPGVPHLHVRGAIRQLARIEDVVRLTSEPSAVVEDRDDDLSHAATAYWEMVTTTRCSEAHDASSEISRCSSETTCRGDLRLITKSARWDVRHPWWRELYTSVQRALTSRARVGGPEGARTHVRLRLERSLGWLSRDGL
jgi:hypothetical protein